METIKVMVGGKEMDFSKHEMKHIADKYWEHWGKHSMLDFAKKMKLKAADNIADALAMFHKPESEDEVKNAIAHALFIAFDSGDWDLLAEVLYESSEFAAASYSVYNIEEPEED